MEQDAAKINAFYDGMKEALRMYAWWKAGTQYVGSPPEDEQYVGCGVRTLKEALDEIDKRRTDKLQRIWETGSVT